MISLRESLIGNIKNPVSNNIKKTLDSPVVKAGLVRNCIKSEVDLQVSVNSVEKIKEDIVVIYAKDFNRYDYINIDLDQWEQYQLPKYIAVSNYGNMVKIDSRYMPRVIISCFKKGKVDGYTFGLGGNDGLYFSGGLYVTNPFTDFTNCLFLNGFDFGFSVDGKKELNDYFELKRKKVNGKLEFAVDFGPGFRNPAECIKINKNVSGNIFKGSIPDANINIKCKKSLQKSMDNIGKDLELKYGRPAGNLSWWISNIKYE